MGFERLWDWEAFQKASACGICGSAETYGLATAACGICSACLGTDHVPFGPRPVDRRSAADFAMHVAEVARALAELLAKPHPTNYPLLLEALQRFEASTLRKPAPSESAN